jgi:hypothetical protein
MMLGVPGAVLMEYQWVVRLGSKSVERKEQMLVQ